MWLAKPLPNLPGKGRTFYYMNGTLNIGIIYTWLLHTVHLKKPPRIDAKNETWLTFTIINFIGQL